MYTTPSGILIADNLSQSEKVFGEISLTPSGIVTYNKLQQPEKAPPPMYVTLLGIIMPVRPDQS